MRPSELWNDYRFRTLLSDLYKARNDNELGPMRLDALLNYAIPVQREENFTRPVQYPKAYVEQASPLVEPDPVPAGLLLDDEALPATALGYVDRQRALRQSPNVALAKAADVVEAAYKAGAWDGTGVMQIPLPKGMVVSGLESFLRQERKLAFTKLTVSLPPKGMKLDKNGGLAATSEASITEGKAAGWVVVLVK